jgi:fatty acid desaturase
MGLLSCFEPLVFRAHVGYARHLFLREAISPVLTAFADALTAHPIRQFKRNRFFYALYDGFYLVASALVLGLLIGFGIKPVFGSPSWWWVGAFPAMLFCFIWAHLVIHNCTHGNLPKAVNRLVGEVLGVLVVVRFASWDIIHMRHHRYSDDRTKDPHPNFASFWTTVWHTIVNVEAQLFQEYYDTWGDTPQMRQREKRRALLSYGANVVLVAAWFFALGPWFFLLVFAPTNLIAGLFVIHFNWSTHNGERGSADADFRPVNLNSGYYWLGNKLFAGIYMHANHHTRPTLFNPAQQWNEAEHGPSEPTADQGVAPV